MIVDPRCARTSRPLGDCWSRRRTKWSWRSRSRDESRPTPQQLW